MPTAANMPLAGIIVLDFGQVYQGPYATLLMAKAGADVIKIEPPQGEPLRRRAPPGKSTTFPIAMLNSNKRAITLNLKDERGRALLFRMVEQGDVLLENFAPGVMDRLGVGWEVLHEVNPRLVYASGSGYGLTGPDRDNLAMDLTIQAVSGLISVDRLSGRAAGQGRAGGRRFPLRHPSLRRHGDRALRARAYRQGPPRRGGDGRGRLRDPDLATARLFRDRQGAAAHRQCQPRPRAAQRLPDQGRLCRDEPRGRGALAQPAPAMGREDLRDDPRFADNAARVANREVTDAPIAAWTRTLGKMEIFAIAKRHRIPLAPVREVDEVMHDRHMHERGMLEWIEHDEIGRIVVPTSPLRFHGADPVETTPSPKLGQHNREIYGGWLGLSADEIAALKQDGVI